MSVAIEMPPRGQDTPRPRPRYSIVVPAYNERDRIGATLGKIVEHVRAQGWDVEIVVVDDGSRDGTFDFVHQMASEYPEIRVIQNPGNRGKGYAVRNGMLNAIGDVLLFTDADLSSPITEAASLFAALERGADVAIGSRWLDPSLQFQRQSLKRQMLSRVYNLFLRTVLWFPYRDTQCGFKAFTRRAAEEIFPQQRISRWGFDPEIIFLAHGLGFQVVEVPVRWGHDDGSKVSVWRDGLRMAVDTLRIRWHALRGDYSLAAKTRRGQPLAGNQPLQPPTK